MIRRIKAWLRRRGFLAALRDARAERIAVAAHVRANVTERHGPFGIIRVGLWWQVVDTRYHFPRPVARAALRTTAVRIARQMAESQTQEGIR